MNFEENPSAFFVEQFFDSIDSIPDEDREAVLKNLAYEIAYKEKQDGIELFEKILTSYSQHKDIKDLNLQILGVVDLMRAMLSGFDTDDNKTINSTKNIEMFGKFMMVCGFPLQNLLDNMSKIQDKYKNQGANDMDGGEES